MFALHHHSRRLLRLNSNSTRNFATRRRVSPIPAQILDAFPVYPEAADAVNPTASPVPNDGLSSPVTSAHWVDTFHPEVSALDSAALDPTNGTIVHGRYGDLGASAVPLEFLALLRPAAEGAAALRMLSEKKSSGSGTILVYGATQASGLAAAQLAAASGHAVVAVVDAQHSGNDDMLEAVKGLIPEPGTAVPEEYALSKSNFQQLVQGVAAGDEGIPSITAEQALADFKEKFIQYSEAYPDTRPAAVSEDHMDFKFMEKDRENWELNMSTYLAQFPKGAPPADKAKLDALFSAEQYEIFRRKFGEQTTAVISGDDPPFSAPHIVHEQIQAPEALPKDSSSTSVPYTMNILKQTPYAAGTEPTAGGPVVGAVVVVTPALARATAWVAKAKTLREKAEALQFLSASDRATYLAATSVVAQAGGNVVTIGGSLAQATEAQATDADVQTALRAMDIDESGNSSLNYFCQVFRANDFPVYGDYAVHRASEPLAGPRQIVVTK